MIKHVMKNVDVYVDSEGYLGTAEELEPPNLTINTEEYRPAGYDVPFEIDMGMEKLECTMITTGLDAGLLKHWGVTAGAAVPLVLRAAQEDSSGAWKSGERVPNKMMFRLEYYKLEIDGRVMHEIDVHAVIRIIDGVDQLAARRAAPGRA